DSELAVAEAVKAAVAESAPLSIEGGGTRGGLGRPAQSARTLSLAALRGVTLYEPAEMVIGGWAGTPLAEISDTLAARGQMLAFEPMDHRTLFGGTGAPTIGAVAACNISGPRRVMSGACRDSLIGVRFVNGRGEIIKSGGRVMKNVTGLDLVKLQAGAFGTLGVLTEVIFKVIPRPAQVATLVIDGLSDARGIEALCSALGSPFEPTGAAHLPAGLAGAAARTLLRIEGFPEQIAYRSAALRERLKDFGDLRDASDGQDALWVSIRDAAFLASPQDDAVWRLSLPPGKAAAALGAVRSARPVRGFFDWGGGLLWLATPEGDDAGQAVIRAAASAAAGHATLVRGSTSLRSRIDVFQPLDGPLTTAQRGVKAAFDPAGLLNPGRMYAGV
ncbi:MAG: glycolate oxidase subunit GlcE, partial [Beijerinckiaceae bacterium]